MQCTNCGAQLEDSVEFCPVCGARQTKLAETPPVIPESVSTAEESGMPPLFPEQTAQAEQPAEIVAEKKKGGFWKVILAAILVAALTIGGFFAWKQLSKEAKVESPLEKAVNSSAEDLRSLIAPLPNLTQIVDNVKAMKDTKTTSIGLDFNMGEEGSIHATLSEDLKKKVGSLSAELNISGLSLPFNMYLDENQIQIASSAFLEEGEAIMLPVKDLAAKWNASALAQMTKVELPEDMDFASLMNSSGEGYEKLLEEVYGKSWLTFRDSVKFTKLETADAAESAQYFNVENGETYVLEWDKTALDALVKEAGVENADLSVDVQDVDALKNLNIKEYAAKSVVSVLKQSDEKVKRVEILVENEKATGLYFKGAQDGKEGFAVFHLEGKENLWNNIYVMSGEDGKIDSYMVQFTVDGDTLQITAEEAVEGGSGNRASVKYNDKTGEVEMIGDGDDILNGVTIAIKPVDKGFSVDAAGADIDGTIKLEITTKIGDIKALSDAPTKILDLSQQELQAFIMKIYEKVAALQQN